MPELETYTLPDFWACPIFNDDWSATTDEEDKEIKAFLEARAKDGYYPTECSEESFFKWSNDATSLGGNCLEYTFLKSIQHETTAQF